jgi:subtilisin
MAMSGLRNVSAVARVTAASVLLVTAVLVSSSVGAAPSSTGYIVSVAESLDPVQVATSVGVVPDMVFTDAINGYAADLTSTQLRNVKRHPATVGVEVEANVPAEIPAATVQAAESTQIVTNSVRRVGGLESPTARIDGVDERVDIDVAIIDTGIDVDHPDLNVAGGVDCAGKKKKKLSYDDREGHGTMVAGYVGALDNSYGRVGIAPGARVWGVRVVKGSGFIADRNVICALDWVAANANTIEIANMSFGEHLKANKWPTSCSDAGKKAALHRAVCRAAAAGVIMVAGAGNDSRDASRYVPAAYGDVMAVSAISDKDGLSGGLGGNLNCLPGEVDDTFATYSNYGPIVDLAAPGSCNSSTYPDGLYAVASGTSFSSPLVAGAVALYLANDPDAAFDEIRQALIDHVEPGPIPGDPDAHPEGVLNVRGF